MNHVLFLFFAIAQAVAGDHRLSAFGRYAGYSRAEYDGWQRSSFFIAVRDGTRLACDLFRPTLEGKLATRKLPLVWTHHRYQRCVREGGRERTILDIYPHLTTLLAHGYLVAAVDVRGSGASFGVWRGLFHDDETRDARDVIEWFAAQDFCDGNIGMFGSSYLGGDEFTAASVAPPHLKAIFPWVAPYDLYDFVCPGGIPRRAFLEEWTRITQAMDHSPSTAPVDGDRDRALLHAAQREHDGNLDLARCLRALGARDSTCTVAGAQAPLAPYEAWNPASRCAAIERAHVAIYHMAGWYDVFVDGTPHWLARLATPQKAVFGPWFHLERDGVDWSAETRRWFDCWLKGIDNGITREPAVHYYVLGADEWRAADTFPPPQTVVTAFALAQGPCGSIDSVNRGVLARGTADERGDDAYRVRYDTTTGLITRTGNAVAHGGFDVEPPVLTENDRLGLTYTSAALAEPLDVVGYAVLHLWLQCDAPDTDVFAVLEDVLPVRAQDSGGWRSTYVSEGCLRASHRALASRIAGDIDVPRHASVEAAVAPLPDEPVELVIALYPTACRFAAGHRLRLTLTGADRDNYATPVADPAPEWHVLRGGDHPSRLELPLMPGRR